MQMQRRGLLGGAGSRGVSGLHVWSMAAGRRARESGALANRQRLVAEKKKAKGLAVGDGPLLQNPFISPWYHPCVNQSVGAVSTLSVSENDPPCSHVAPHAPQVVVDRVNHPCRAESHRRQRRAACRTVLQKRTGLAWGSCRAPRRHPWKNRSRQSSTRRQHYVPRRRSRRTCALRGHAKVRAANAHVCVCVLLAVHPRLLHSQEPPSQPPHAG